MSEHRYRVDGMTVLVVTGMPEQYVQIGIGSTVAAARASLEETPIQSAGRPGEAVETALTWARNQGWISRLPRAVRS